MGVPKFFRWISERYPCLSVSVHNNQIPDFDCLYLDMNGIIHICSHPDDTNIHFRISETDIFSNIFNYVEFLFKTVKPKEVFFLAIDGVAPRAKMNQQRARRLKSAKEALNREEAAIQSGLKLPEGNRFDSNAITPGTEFMDRLNVSLQSFLDMKIKTDSLWQGVDVILSGHETPGEGEHKIQEFIRYRRSLATYNPNTRHCLYGLDADLMLLGLASHEPYFSLLREDVSYSKKKIKRAYIAEETKFFLLHLSLLREYIDYEFSALKSVLNDDYNLERIIDDWILLTFFVGNDFVPHLPNLHIHTSALPRLWETYIRKRPSLSGYINNCGKLDIDNLLSYVEALSKFDEEIFMENYEDMKWMMGKRGERLNHELENLDHKKPKDYKLVCDYGEELNHLDSLADMFSSEQELVNDSLFVNNDAPLEEEEKDSLDSKQRPDSSDDNPSDLISPMETLKIDKDLIEFDFDDDENENMSSPLEPNAEYSIAIEMDPVIEGGDDQEIWDLQYRCYKRDYYYSKMGLTCTDEVLEELVKEYFAALQWVSYYYFTGVSSWDWFYPQHYAPFVSDLCHINDNIRLNGISFNLGQPFMPFQQMMAVLPADSCELIPPAFRSLMTDESSPIIDFYPKTFKTDLNGKKKDWEAVILIPFIDEKRLLQALEPKMDLLTESELKRNVHGPHLKYRHSNGELSITEISADVFRIPQSSIITGLCPNVRTDLICQGFPSLQHIDHTFALDKIGVKVFEFPANSSSMLLTISPPKSELLAETIARKYIDKVAYVNWPALYEVKVVAVLNETHKFTIDPQTKKILINSLSDYDRARMTEFKNTTPRNLYKRSAIKIDETNFIVLETYHSGGKTYEISGTHKAGSTIRLAHNWNTNRTFWYLQQLSILKESINTLESSSSKICTKLNQLFPTKATVFSLDPSHYGRCGSVVSIKHTNSSITVDLDPQKDPILPVTDASTILQDYMNAAQAVGFIDISANLFSRITGTLYINLHRSTSQSDQKPKKSDKNNKNQVAIGLELKNNKLNLQIPGWVVKSRGENMSGRWLYSRKVVDVLKKYQEAFPEIFKFIQQQNFESMAFEDIYEKEILTKKSEELSQFLANLPYNTVERIGGDCKIVCESNIQLLEKSMDNVDHESVIKAAATIELPFHDVYRPHQSLHGVQPDKSTDFELFDRVVCSTDGYTVPLGLRGVVIGIEYKLDSIRLEVLFDKPFKSAISIRGSGPRCYRMSSYALINVTYGMRQLDNRTLLRLPNHDTNLPKIESNKPLSASPKKKLENRGTEVTPTIVHTFSSNNIKPTKSSVPPIPPSEFLDDAPATNNHSQSNFIAHCNKVYQKRDKASRCYENVYTLDNCIFQYRQLFAICMQNGILAPRVIERFDNDYVYISFQSAMISLPETKEVNLISGRGSIINRVMTCLFPQWSSQSAGTDWYHSSPHYYMPEQFSNNPFMQVYPPQQFRRSNNQNFRQALHIQQVSPPNPVTTIPVTPSASEPVTNGDQSNSKTPGSTGKRFIRKPKSNNSIIKS